MKNKVESLTIDELWQEQYELMNSSNRTRRAYVVRRLRKVKAALKALYDKARHELA